MGRKRDPFWEYGEILGNKFQCNYCKNMYSRGITRLKFHLSGLKGNDVEVCTQAPRDVQVKACMAVASYSKRPKNDAGIITSVAKKFEARDHSCSLGFPGMSNLLPLFKGKGVAHQTSISDMLNKMGKSDVDKLLANFFVLNNISFDVVQTRSFIDLVRALCEFGPAYKLPNCSTLKRKLVPEAEKETNGYIGEVKKSWEKTGGDNMNPIDLDKLKEWPDCGDNVEPEINELANAEYEPSTFTFWEQGSGIPSLKSICLTINDDNMDDFRSLAYDGGGLDQEPAGESIRQRRGEYDDKKQLATPFSGIASLVELDSSFIIKERMTQALQYFKESIGQNQILAQVWAPVKNRDHYVLSTAGQPFVLGPHSYGLLQFRTVSLMYMFAVDGEINGTLGLPGRVFRKKLPEWTPNVQYYSTKEHPMVIHAKHFNVRGALALPVFEPSGQSCIAVLELVMTMEKINYAPEVDNICKALEAVHLKSSEIFDHTNIQICDEGRQNALPEILEVLTEVCETYKLPMAQTWLPCMHRGALAKGGDLKESYSSFHGSCMEQVCMSTSYVAFYVVDAFMWGFRDACAEHHLQKGQGVVGRALASHGLCFCTNISLFQKSEYPLLHYAHMFGIYSSFAICLRGQHTGDDDYYILEFFLPPSITNSTEQLNLLDSILTKMNQGFQSLVVASGRTLEERMHMETVELSIGCIQDLLSELFP